MSIYVDSLGDDAISKEMQSMIVSALVASKRFKVTETRERADAILKARLWRKLHRRFTPTAKVRRLEARVVLTAVR